MHLLEVLQHNTKAVSVYRNLGFETTREFNYFVQKNEAVKVSGASYSVERIDIGFLEAKNIDIRGTQFEMIKKI